jgi:Spy/CpxP family protein refolding chaperone
VKIWKVILAVVVIFGAGMVTGGLVVRTQMRAAQKVPAAVPGGPPGSGMWSVSRSQFIDKMHRQLSLTPQQCKQVDKIMKASHDRMAKLWEPISPQAKEETKNVREEILAVLTPDQRPKFEEIFKSKYRKERSNTNGTNSAEIKKDSLVKECCSQMECY